MIRFRLISVVSHDDVAGPSEPIDDRRNMKPCSEMLLEVTVYCGKVRDQRGCQNMKYTTVEAS